MELVTSPSDLGLGGVLAKQLTANGLDPAPQVQSHRRRLADIWAQGPRCDIGETSDKYSCYPQWHCRNVSAVKHLLHMKQSASNSREHREKNQSVLADKLFTVQ